MMYDAGRHDWPSFGQHYKRYFDTAAERSEYPIDNLSYAVFEHVSEAPVLATAVRADHFSLVAQGENSAVQIDTYANLLYKSGRHRDALQWQQRAMELGGVRDREIAQHFEKMKSGQPTWPEQGVIGLERGVASPHEAALIASSHPVR
jgi:hypothetical protein